MSTLYIGEYSDIGSVGRGSVPIPQEPPHGEQAVDFSVTSKASDTLSDATCIVRLVSDDDCAISVGADPDATNSVRLVSANKEQLLTVVAGSKMKIAVVATGGVASGFDSLDALLRIVTSPIDAKKQFDLLAVQAAKADAATKALRVASDADRMTKDDLDAATKKAEAAKAANDRSVADIAAAAAAAAAKEARRVTQVEADKTAAAARKADLDAQAVSLAALSDRLGLAFNKVDIAETDLAKRETELVNAKDALAIAQAGYEERVAKLKALTG